MQHILAKKGQCTLIKDGKALAAFTPSLIFALDIETHGAEGKVGDCAQNPAHGVAGIALCTAAGDAAYIVIDYGRGHGGLDIKYVVDFLNKNWLVEGAVMVLHNCKFDLAFLLPKGLDISKVRIVDTFIGKNIRNQGVFTSNKLKDIMRETFKVETDSEEKIKKWLQEHNTEDYGDIPPEVMGPYACDDVRYALVVMFNSPPLDEQEAWRHDLYIRNTLHVIAMEQRGFMLDIPLMRKRINDAVEGIKNSIEVIRSNLGSAKIDIENDQEMLKFLHSRELHPGPRFSYGEMKYVVDEEFLMSCDHPLSQSYLKFSKLSRFLHQFSGNYGRMAGRIFGDEKNAGLYMSFLLSYSTKAGAIQCKCPDLHEGVNLGNDIRALFRPRAGHVLYTVRVTDLPVQLLAFYCEDARVAESIGQGGASVCAAYNSYNGFGVLTNSLLLQKVVEGSGYAILERRLKLADIKVKGKYNGKTLHNQFEGMTPGYQKLFSTLQQALQTNGFLSDRVSAKVRVPQDKWYRALALLLSSSVGNIRSVYFDAMCQVLKKNGAHLVFAQGPEWVFEAPEKNDTIPQLVQAVAAQTLTLPVPKFLLNTCRERWVMPHLDAHEYVSGAWA